MLFLRKGFLQAIPPAGALALNRYENDAYVLRSGGMEYRNQGS